MDELIIEGIYKKKQQVHTPVAKPRKTHPRIQVSSRTPKSALNPFFKQRDQNHDYSLSKTLPLNNQISNPFRTQENYYKDFIQKANLYSKYKNCKFCQNNPCQCKKEDIDVYLYQTTKRKQNLFTNIESRLDQRVSVMDKNKYGQRLPRLSEPARPSTSIIDHYVPKNAFIGKKIHSNFEFPDKLSSVEPKSSAAQRELKFKLDVSPVVLRKRSSN